MAPIKIFGLPVAEFSYEYAFSGESIVMVSYFDKSVSRQTIAKAANLKPGKAWTYAGRNLPEGRSLAIGRDETTGRFSLVCNWFVAEDFS